MNLLSRQDLLTPAKRRYELVQLSDGRGVRLQSLNELEKSEYETAVLDSEGDIDTREWAKQRRRLITLCVVDAEGHRLLSEDDVEQLGHADPELLELLNDRCRELCRLKRRAEAVGDAEKNSDATAG